jgi:hypothetical protein
VIWCTDVDLLLDEDAQLKLLSGTHEIQERGITAGYYFAGLDLAGGSQVTGTKTDFSTLSIWDYFNGMKLLRFQKKWKGDFYDQMEDILSIIHPLEGLFRCKKVLVDYERAGAVIVDVFKRQGINIEGVAAKGKDPAAGKEYKQSMYDHMLMEIKGNRVKYPRNYEKNLVMKEGADQWLAIERTILPTGRIRIAAPSGMHDDHCYSDILAVFAADREFNNLRQVLPSNKKYFPDMVSVPNTNIRFDARRDQRGIRI